MFFNVRDCVGSKPIAGDTVKFDVADSDTKPGQLKAWKFQVGWEMIHASFFLYLVEVQAFWCILPFCLRNSFWEATNITGGSQSLDTPHPGTKPSWDSWGGMGDMGAALGAMAAMFSSMGGKGWASGGKGWGGKGGGKQWGGDGGSWSSSGKGGSYGPQSGSAPVPPGPYSPGGCAKGGWWWDMGNLPCLKWSCQCWPHWATGSTDWNLGDSSPSCLFRLFLSKIR